MGVAVGTVVANVSRYWKNRAGGAAVGTNSAAGRSGDHGPQPASVGSFVLPLRVDTVSVVPAGSVPCSWSLPKRLVCPASRAALV